ncbi:hypothetical protein ACNHFS_004698 [Yersinia enterocolitica]
MNNIEELKSAYRDVELTARNMRGKPEEYRVVTGFCPVNVVEMQAQKIQALIAKLEGAQKERDDLREKVNQADSEWHKMADRILSAGKRAEKAETALSAANQPWRSFVTNDDISALNRFAECCDDPESGGHDLDKDQVERLVSIGALRKTKRNYHETTDFGDFVISAGFTVEGE